jgi:prolyl 4-hydroxylase
MFERIVANAPGNQTEETQLLAQQKQVQDDGVPYYTVHVHSRPESVSSITDVDHDIVSRKADLEEAPWVVTFDNFLTDEECDHLIELGHVGGYQRSKDVGIRTADGSYSGKVSTTRTSENAWCSGKTGCRDDAIATRVRDRISNVTQIPSQNFEDYQMLKYEKEQFYQLHHDYIPHQRERACGPRILTFFLYLSDVEEGGGTGLDQINGGLVVNPKKGKALLWPSVLNYDPSEKDGRTTHEAIAVKEGTKFAANTWIHLYDVIESQKRGCT